MDKEIKKNIKFSNLLLDLLKLEDFELQIIIKFINSELKDRLLQRVLVGKY